MKYSYMPTSEADVKRYIKNINGLSVGDRAHCGRFGIIECYKPATFIKSRKFKVSKSTVLTNRGNWDMTSLRKAITAVH